VGIYVKCDVCNGTGLRRFRPYLTFDKPLYTEDECAHCLGHGIIPGMAAEYCVVFTIEGKEDSINVLADSPGEAMFQAARSVGPMADQIIEPGESFIIEVIAQ
jgi:hypothetical protein